MRLRLDSLSLVVIVDAKECADESEDFAKGYEYRGVDFTGGRYDEARNEQTTADDDECHGADELQGVLLCVPRFLVVGLQPFLWGVRNGTESVVRFHFGESFGERFMVSFGNYVSVRNFAATQVPPL